MIQFLIVWWQVVVGVISFGGCLCYSVPCSSSLALVCIFGGFKVFTLFGGSESR